MGGHWTAIYSRSAVRTRNCGEARTTVPCEGKLWENHGPPSRATVPEAREGGTVMLCDLIFHRKGEPIREFRKAAWRTASRIARVKKIFSTT